MHGDESGSVDRHHNLFGSPLLDARPQRVTTEHQLMDQAPDFLDQTRRRAVLDAIQEVCTHRHWCLLAAHIRTNHVHVIVEANVPPERVMNDLKSYASRRLTHLGLDERNRKRRARHGSTLWLWKDHDVRSAMRYVIDEQGEPMEVFAAEPETAPWKTRRKSLIPRD